MTRDKHGKVTRDMFDIPPTIDELAQDVFLWAEETFPNRTDGSMYLKLYGEVAELIDSGGEPHELADIFILLLDYAKRKNIDITTAVLEKLHINRRRDWYVTADGTMRHKGFK